MRTLWKYTIFDFKCTTSPHSILLSTLLFHKIHSEKHVYWQGLTHIQPQIYVCGAGTWQDRGVTAECSTQNLSSHALVGIIPAWSIHFCRVEQIYSILIGYRHQTLRHLQKSITHKHMQKMTEIWPLKESSWCISFQFPPKKYLNLCRLSCIRYVYVRLLTTAYTEKYI